MRMKKIPVRMLAILLVCMTVLLSVCLELLSVPAMAAEEKAACYTDRKSTRLNSSHPNPSRMPSSA